MVICKMHIVQFGSLSLGIIVGNQYQSISDIEILFEKIKRQQFQIIEKE